MPSALAAASLTLNLSPEGTRRVLSLADEYIILNYRLSFLLNATLAHLIAYFAVNLRTSLGIFRVVAVAAAAAPSANNGRVD